MSDLKEKIIDIVLGSVQFVGAGQDAVRLADRILAIPEIAEALHVHFVEGLVRGVGQRLGHSITVHRD